MNRQEFLDLLAQCNPRTRRTTLRLIEGKAQEDNAAFVQERLDFIDRDGTVRSVDLISSRTCSFGHCLDQQTRLVGVCEVCHAYTCSVGATSGAPGKATSPTACSFSCVKCGCALCRRHVHISSDGETYCPRCWPARLLKVFLYLIGRIVK